jgi:hypothetical protein
MKWDGEWHITLEVFRDLGLAFCVVLVLIYMLMVGWFKDYITPLVVMAAIPFSLIGILPAHWALGAFFTATSMIGFMAGPASWSATRSSSSISSSCAISHGLPLAEAVVEAGARPFPPHAADRAGRRGRRFGDPGRPDLPGTGHLADVRRDRLAADQPDGGAGALSTFAGEHPETLSKLFPGINHLVRGEGENSLAELVAHYCQKNDEVVQAPPQLPPAGAITDLDTLPTPDFGEYFLFLKKLPDSRRFFPVLPLEMSRGCRWQARYDHQGGSENSGRGACAFCNLNLQWQGYRHKSATKVAAEISLLTKRHQVLSLAFMDNLLPPKEGDNLMRILGGDGQDLQIFAEIRADTTADRLHTMYRAGVRSLQVGIEALSSTLLEKMGKGTSVMDNIEMMRHCEALGIPHGGNLLLRFPGSDEDDVAQTLANLRRVWVFRPLQAVHFWLGLHSPVHDHPTTYNITPTGNHRHWKTLLGKRLAGQLQLLIQGYRGQQRNQQRLWAPVASALKTWQRSYSALSTEGSGRNRSPILSYQDGGDFLILSERKIGGDHLTHRLPSASRRLYLYCRTSRSRVQLQTAFAGISSDRLDGFLAMMVDKGLMFEENTRYLSLAVPIEAGEEQLDEIVSGVKG